ncbi:MAG: hypothetical protein AB7O59_12325 [Pirellulales bacterium]
MGIVVKPYTAEHREAVRAFNERLRAGGVNMRFPESHIPPDLPKLEGKPVYYDYLLALDEGAVRGAYMLKHQPFEIAGQVNPLALYRLPLSEGCFDKRFSALGVQLFLDALRRAPLLYTVGLGGYDEAITQLLVRAGWSTWAVPFYFRVLRPAAFLRNIVYLRRTPARRAALDVLAATGLGTLGVGAYQLWKAGRLRAPAAPTSCSIEASFGPWADDIWNAARGEYSMIAVRDAHVLNTLYPPGDDRWVRLRVAHAGRTVGWAAVLNVPMDGHNYFGNMRVGSLVDCLSVPGMETEVARAAVQYLQQTAADIVVANFSHHRWRAALAAAGMFEGPSNYIFAASKNVSAMLNPFEERKHSIHMTRGDGVGAENLIAARK